MNILYFCFLLAYIDIVLKLRLACFEIRLYSTYYPLLGYVIMSCYEYDFIICLFCYFNISYLKTQNLLFVLRIKCPVDFL